MSKNKKLKVLSKAFCLEIDMKLNISNPDLYGFIFFTNKSSNTPSKKYPIEFLTLFNV